MLHFWRAQFNSISRSISYFQPSSCKIVVPLIKVQLFSEHFSSLQPQIVHLEVFVHVIFYLFYLFYFIYLFCIHAWICRKFAVWSLTVLLTVTGEVWICTFFNSLRGICRNCLWFTTFALHIKLAAFLPYLLIFDIMYVLKSVYESWTRKDHWVQTNFDKMSYWQNVTLSVCWLSAC